MRNCVKITKFAKSLIFKIKIISEQTNKANVWETQLLIQI